MGSPDKWCWRMGEQVGKDPNHPPGPVGALRWPSPDRSQHGRELPTVLRSQSRGTGQEVPTRGRAATAARFTSSYFPAGFQWLSLSRRMAVSPDVIAVWRLSSPAGVGGSPRVGGHVSFTFMGLCLRSDTLFSVVFLFVGRRMLGFVLSSRDDSGWCLRAESLKKTAWVSLLFPNVSSCVTLDGLLRIPVPLKSCR